MPIRSSRDIAGQAAKDPQVLQLNADRRIRSV